MSKAWSAADLDVLRRLYPNTPTKAVAAALGRAVGTVYQRANIAGLKKSAEYLASPCAGRIRNGRAPGCKRNQFKKGMTPWNLGKRGYMGANRTSFRKGRPPQEARNYRPVGSLRISRDGYVERKVTDDHPVPARRWVSVHRLIWEAAHGPVPAGHAVTFKKGRHTTDPALITLDALELLSRAELMARNTYHRYGKEIARAIQLRGALMRQINKRTKHREQQDHRSS